MQARWAVLIMGAAFLGQPVLALDCGEFQLDPGGAYCITPPLTFPWVAFGGGWTTTIRAANISPEIQSRGLVYFSVELRAAVPKTDEWWNHIPAMARDNRWVPYGTVHNVESFTYLLQPGESVEAVLLSPPAGCDIHGQNCDYNNQDPSKTSVGYMVATFAATNPAYLRELVQPWVQFNHINGWQASEAAIGVRPVWRTAVSANKLGDGASMAMSNPSDKDVEVEGSLLNQLGKVVARQTWVIPARGTVGAVFGSPREGTFAPGIGPGFGSEMYDDRGVFTGWVEVKTKTPGDAVSMVVLQYTGGGMSSANVMGYDY